MPDNLTPEQRKYCMSRVRGRDTKPELIVRKMLHALGYRYRLNVASLPGKPDIVFPKRGKAIFIHGCYWHRHRCQKGRMAVRTNVDFWEAKLRGNASRDARVIRVLRNQGWKVAVVWECQTQPRHRRRLVERLVRFLESE